MCYSSILYMFHTSDIQLASALHCSGLKLLKVDQSAKRAQFCFEGTEAKIEKLVARYWDDSLTLPAAKLLACHKALKNRLYDGSNKSV